MALTILCEEADRIHGHTIMCVYTYIHVLRIRIGYTLGSYPRWLLITPEGVISNHRGDFSVYTANQGISNL